MDYAQAFLTMVRAAVAHRADVEVFDHAVDPDVDAVPTRYVVVYVENPQRLTEAADDRVSGRRLVARVICCSSSPGEAARETRRMDSEIGDYLVERRLRPGGQLIKHHAVGSLTPDPELLVSRRVAEHASRFSALC